MELYHLHQSEIAVVITDMAMPVMGGPETIRALVAKNPAVKIVGSSGECAEEDLKAATDMGVKHFIAKPYTTETILRILQELISETAGQQA